MDPTIRESIHRIWDDLAEYPVSQSGNEALQYLLQSIATLIDAGHSYWLSALRMKHGDVDADLMLGWRPGPVVFGGKAGGGWDVYRKYSTEIDAGEYDVDESSLNHVKQAGRFRATLIRDHVSPGFFDTLHYRSFYRKWGITDTLFVVAPVNRDAEVYFCFNRHGDSTPFGQAELDIAADTLRSLNWFHRNVLLGHGLLIGDKPLTPKEKKIMHWLLTDLSEKEIASRLEQKYDTIHKHVVNIYRKFNVNSRPALMAIWLGRAG